MFWQALLLQAGYNATLVTVGAALLGVAAGAVGSVMVLRKRALVADAMAHATLPGVAMAFMVMVWLGGDGRSLAGLMAGAALSAGCGLLTVDWITRKSRLAEDAAIGAVLSVFFGAGIVGLTVIQTMQGGRQAGLEGFLLGATAGMLWADALVIAGGGAVAVALVWLLRRPLLLVAFDPGFAETVGISPRRADLILMALVMAVTVIGLKVVGLILVVALLIIPAVAARFWTDRAGAMVWIAGAIGGAASYLGAVISTLAPALPTGPIIVLLAAGVFLVSLLFAPARGAVPAALRHRRVRALRQAAP
ncbi:MAG: metal ABC transporter permease [Rhodobacterales bacterium]|nr:metal ABC transporter permease [Rhodobacterales bacterium]NCT13141.1 metal ABC transporter permease [Rhodobacterales bacterium]